MAVWCCPAEARPHNSANKVLGMIKHRAAVQGQCQWTQGPAHPLSIHWLKMR